MMPLKQLLDLSGRTALVTGGSRGLGLQIAEGLAEMGARIIVTARRAEELESAVERLSRFGQASWIAADAADPAAVARLAEEAVGRLGQVDILVNNAGATWGAPAEDYPAEA
jgi:NAD(P)-dependent dehydrogenase (short-subunit alcohol dehydrogenase family)